MKISKLSKAIGYLRTATSTEDSEENSLYNQKKDIVSWAKENDIEIEKFYSDVGSAYKRKRPLLELMIEEIEKRIVTPDALIVASSSRLSRNLETNVRLENFLRNKSIEIISVNELLSNPLSTAFSLEAFIGLSNELLRKRNSKNVHNWLNDNARKGYFTGGIIPFGYQTAPVKNNERRKELIRNPCESVIVEEIFRLAISGLYGTPFKIKEISNHLNKRNRKYRGKRWAARFVSSILKNTLYYGERVWGKSRGFSYKNVQPIVTKNQPIISKQIFLKVQKKLAKPIKIKGVKYYAS